MSRSSIMFAHAPRRARPVPSLIRCIADDRGREWRVREVCSPAGHALLFQCAVRGVPSEVRAADAPLASLSDDALAGSLVRFED